MHVAQVLPWPQWSPGLYHGAEEVPCGLSFQLCPHLKGPETLLILKIALNFTASQVFNR